MNHDKTRIAYYAAAAVVSAAALIYILGPSIYPDTSESSCNRTEVVGLSNSGNDCYINSVLQALTGVRRFTEDLPEVGRYDKDVEKEETIDHESYKLSIALTRFLDRLNRKPSDTSTTISPKPFIRAVEQIFGSRVSRKQQDAQEFLHILLERLCEEHKRSDAPDVPSTNPSTRLMSGNLVDGAEEAIEEERASTSATSRPFPCEGEMSSQIECLTCHYEPQATTSSFVVLSLTVPQSINTTVDDCLDGLLKEEKIEGYSCKYCRLSELRIAKLHTLQRTVDPERIRRLEADIMAIGNLGPRDSAEAIESYQVPDEVPTIKRRISRFSRISLYPAILVVHLSRSMFDGGSSASKNKARVKFGEILTLGSFDRKYYKLMAMITHLGGHNSGHYEAYRRQVSDSSLVHSRAHESKNANSNPRSKKTNWWRISDERVRECTTRETLAMQEQVYLLFYERI